MNQSKATDRKQECSEHVVENDEWLILFSSFRSYLFRLEALPVYASPAETELIERYTRGERFEPTGPLKEYFDSLQQIVDSGRQVERLHVVPDLLTPYLRWEIEWAYRHMADRGVTVFILPESKAPTLAARAYEFYLIDDVHLIRVEYDAQGAFQRLLRNTDPSQIEVANNLRRELLENAVPLDEYLCGI